MQITDVPALSQKRPWLKTNHGLIKLGSWGVCGMAWKWTDTFKPKGIDEFVQVMNRIPVATNKAFRILWENREICRELAKVFKDADNLEFDELKQRISDLFTKINLVIIALPNNFFGIKYGNPVNGKLIVAEKEETSFNKALFIFDNDFRFKHFTYLLHDLDLFNITEAERKALCCRWYEHGYDVSGKIIITDNTNSKFDSMKNRLGREDYYIPRELLKKLADFNL